MLLYLAFCLIGLAVGLWPEAIYPSQADVRSAPLPGLGCLAVAQVAFILLVHPLTLQHRARHGENSIRARPQADAQSGLPSEAQAGEDPPVTSRTRSADARRYWVGAALESATCLLVTVPFYVAAAWLGDAVAKDVVRVGLYVACLFPVGWVAGAYLARGPMRGAVLLVLLLAAAGLPAAYYIAREFLARFPAEWLWRIAPATFAWEQAGSRGSTWSPQPVWAWLLWPAVAGAGAMALLLSRGSPPDARRGG